MTSASKLDEGGRKQEKEEKGGKLGQKINFFIIEFMEQCRMVVLEYFKACDDDENILAIKKLIT